MTLLIVRYKYIATKESPTATALGLALKFNIVIAIESDTKHKYRLFNMFLNIIIHSPYLMTQQIYHKTILYVKRFMILWF